MRTPCERGCRVCQHAEIGHHNDRCCGGEKCRKDDQVKLAELRRRAAIGREEIRALEKVMEKR